VRERCGERVDARAVRHIERPRFDVTARGRQARRRGLGLVRVAAREDHSRAASRELTARLEAQSPVRTGHERRHGDQPTGSSPSERMRDTGALP
jgi:hypothetical protein